MRSDPTLEVGCSLDWYFGEVAEGATGDDDHVAAVAGAAGVVDMDGGVAVAAVVATVDVDRGVVVGVGIEVVAAAAAAVGVDQDIGVVDVVVVGVAAAVDYDMDVGVAAAAAVGFDMDVGPAAAAVAAVVDMVGRVEWVAAQSQRRTREDWGAGHSLGAGGMAGRRRRGVLGI